MKMGLTRAGMRTMVAALEKLTPKAWLSIRTWEALTSTASKPGARLATSGPGGRLIPKAQILDLTIDDFPDVAAQGVATTGGDRYWTLPARVIYDAALQPRLVQLSGATVWRGAAMTTLETQVPGVIAFLTPAGLWADTTQPLWRAVNEIDPGAPYPPAAINTERLQSVLSVTPVTRVAPTFYARL